MKITFKGHQATEREVELTQQELFQLFEMMRQEFKNHITYARFSDSYFTTPEEKAISQYCESHSVDVTYSKDRTAFFYSILDNLKNPYQ